MKISLILPFRKRVDMLYNMLSSVRNTVNNPSNIEVVMAIDYDDLDAMRTLGKIATYPGLKMSILITQPSDFFVRDYFNPCAHMASGRWIIALNDDSEFMTKDWDMMIIERMEEASKRIGDDILLGLINDGIDRHGEDPLYPHFSCWPVASKEMVHVLGFYYDPRVVMWGADHMIARLFRDWCGNKRVVSLTDIFIKHNSVHSGNSTDRRNYERFEKINRQYPVNINEMDNKDAIIKFKNYINGGRKYCN